MSIFSKHILPIFSGLWLSVKCLKPYFLVTATQLFGARTVNLITRIIFGIFLAGLRGRAPKLITNFRADVAFHGGLVWYVLHQAVIFVGTCLRKSRNAPRQHRRVRKVTPNQSRSWSTSTKVVAIKTRKSIMARTLISQDVLPLAIESILGLSPVMVNRGARSAPMTASSLIFPAELAVLLASKVLMDAAPIPELSWDGDNSEASVEEVTTPPSSRRNTLHLSERRELFFSCPRVILSRRRLRGHHDTYSEPGGLSLLFKRALLSGTRIVIDDLFASVTIPELTGTWIWPGIHYREDLYRGVTLFFFGPSRDPVSEEAARDTTMPMPIWKISMHSFGKGSSLKEPYRHQRSVDSVACPAPVQPDTWQWRSINIQDLFNGTPSPDPEPHPASMRTRSRSLSIVELFRDIPSSPYV
ncbi:hypothetical protein BD779DRAFT_1673893 [Infundibulicybe gibba]|nr:hypothetical protein BD779DRAFT_1673893 [Infundibulicybe gibba]